MTEQMIQGEPVDLSAVLEYKMWLPRHDSMADYLRSPPGRVWDYEILVALNKYMDVNSVVLDLGACFGQMTIEFAKRCAQVHSFEAHPFMAEIVRMNMQENNITNVVVHEAAVWDRDGEELIYPRWRSEKINTRAAWGIDPTAKERVDAQDVKMMSMTIDSLQLPRVDAVKIDVQGSDLRAMKGMVNTIQRCRPIILFEYEPSFCVENTLNLPRGPLFQESLDDYYSWIDEVGYQIIEGLPNNNFIIGPK